MNANLIHPRRKGVGVFDPGTHGHCKGVGVFDLRPPRACPVGESG